MGALIGIGVALASMVGGFVAMGGKIGVIWQPWEFLIICGIGAGAFLGGNSMYVVRDTIRASIDAVMERVPQRADNIAVLQVVYLLLSEMKKSRQDVEKHFDNPEASPIFQKHPAILNDAELTQFMCDYARLMVMGNVAKPHEIEALMDHDINTRHKDMLKPYGALSSLADALPAIGIIAAVLGIVKAMGAISQSPEILGALIASALVGTFAGIFLSYVVVAPLAAKVKATREKQARVYMIVKQAFIAFLNGAPPLIAVEYGRKGISPEARPTIDQVEDATVPRAKLEEAA